MPLYEQTCEDCKGQFETIRPFAEGPLKACPKCGGINLYQNYGRVGLKFNGKGFYVNDKKERVIGNIHDKKFAMPSQGHDYE